GTEADEITLGECHEDHQRISPQKTRKTRKKDNSGKAAVRSCCVPLSCFLLLSFFRVFCVFRGEILICSSRSGVGIGGRNRVSRAAAGRGRGHARRRLGRMARAGSFGRPCSEACLPAAGPLASPAVAFRAAKPACAGPPGISSTPLRRRRPP